MNTLDSFIYPRKRILVTGGAGFIGKRLIKNFLENSTSIIFNIDKLSYASDLTFIDNMVNNKKNKYKNRYKFLKIDLKNYSDVNLALNKINPDIIYHLAAESHVDRSIDKAEIFMQSNIIGTFNLLEASLKHYENLNKERKKSFIFHHISTDEVYGSLKEKGSFTEESRYDPRSPYSASKAASDHLVRAWFHTYKMPIIITNCSNNFGPWQFPEKLIPLSILKALKNEEIPLYGNGMNIRDWIFVDDHVSGLIHASIKGSPGETYCIGAQNEIRNIDLVLKICKLLDKIQPKNFKYSDLICFVKDRPGHDQRYSINPLKIKKELNWESNSNFDKLLEETVFWYVNNLDWCENMIKN
tara:strand:- start:37777 stop:38844 length:1068 start_codon:yes stop_codon:yes gene_type:complete